MTQPKQRSHAFTLLRQTLLAAAVIAVVCSVSTSAAAATVTDLKAVHRNGQTFITFTKNSGSGAKTTYDVYRHTSAITSLSGLTKIATLDADSWHLLYHDSGAPPPSLSNGFIITNDGPPLTSTQGLLAWTTATSGTYFYAVTNSTDSTVTLGTNSLTSGVSETYQAVPGAVLLSSTPNFLGTSYTRKSYFAWEDYAAWDHAEWEYYGHRFDVTVPEAAWGLGSPLPLFVPAHAAGDDGYEASVKSLAAAPSPARGVYITTGDVRMNIETDPYTGGHYEYSKWMGRLNTRTGLFMTITQDRVVRYVKLVRDNLTGDGFDFAVNPNRIYILGGSLGAGAGHIASHHPELFAAGFMGVGWVTDEAWGVTPNASTTHVNSVGGPMLSDYQSLAVQSALGAMPPIVHAFGSTDGTIAPDDYPAAFTAFETNHQPYAAQWKVGGHDLYNMAIDYPQWDYTRFVMNEAYPAFGNASTSDTFVYTRSSSAGQRNGTLDWGSELHTIGAPIEDTVNSFGITLRSVSVDTSADVTIRNAQQFLPEAGQRVEWRNESQTGQMLQSGSVVADRQGLVTLRLQITAGGNRLTLSCGSCTASAAAKVPMPPSNVRIVRP